MTSKQLLILLLTATPLFSVAQRSVTVIDINSVASAYVDRPGDLYILHTNNKISKFDTLGMRIENLSFEQPPAVFEPRDGARMFIYFADTRTGSFFSPETKQEFVIQNHYAIE
ncbi:MAG TPA: hypothetical protein VFM90_01690, partial [Cyclobacteriaceae bacterium]|nr:hypothetical protein [Cyclobacteriaceae bacterium]